MIFKYNSKNTHLARTLRKTQTEVERLLWSKLRGKQISGYKFYRQYPIDNYILDFYCPAKKLAIELDGSQHMNNETYDEERTKHLAEESITVLRFWNNDVTNNIDGVLERINEIVTQ
jgi:very-short-patch-repair endonuclease